MRSDLAERLAVFEFYSVDQIYNVVRHLERTSYVKQRRRNPTPEPLEPAFFNPTPSPSPRNRPTRQIYEIIADEEVEAESEVVVLERSRRKSGVVKEQKSQPSTSGRDQGIQTVGPTATDKKTKAENLSCWNCDQNDHTWRQCPKPRTFPFCYECGQKNTITTLCQRCKDSENSGGTGQ